MTTGREFCEHCGAQNESGAAYCENCGQSLRAASPPAPQPVSGDGRGRALAAAAAGTVALLLVGVGVVFAVTRGGDDDTTELSDADGYFYTATEETYTDEAYSEEEVTDTVEPADPLTADEEELYSHIPDNVGTENCGYHDQAPAEALAGALCELTDDELLVEYFLMPDSDSMYGVYDSFVESGEQVTAGDCPDESPSETEWVTAGDDVTRGRWACYVTSLAEGDDAHVVWTHEDFLILSVLSHVGIDPDPVPLVEFWYDGPGPT